MILSLLATAAIAGIIAGAPVNDEVLLRGLPSAVSRIALDMAAVSPLRRASTARNFLTDCSMEGVLSVVGDLLMGWLGAEDILDKGAEVEVDKLRLLLLLPLLLLLLFELLPLVVVRDVDL